MSLRLLVLTILLAALTLMVTPTNAIADLASTPHGVYVGFSPLCGICHNVHRPPAPGKQRDRWAVRTENYHVDITYTGAWTTMTAADRSGGSSTESSQTAAAASLGFYGTEVRLLSTKTPYSGQAEVFIDSVSKGTIDLYDATTTYQAVVFTETSMTTETHFIEIAVSGAKQGASAGFAVDVDALDVTAPRVMLLRKADEKAVCYTCHNGTGSAVNVAEDFGETSSSSPPVSAHPISSNTVLCGDCHSPHRKSENWDATAEQGEVVRLLRGVFKAFIGYITRVPANMPATIPAKPALGIPEQRRLEKPYEQCGSCHGAGSTLPGGNILQYYDSSGTAHDGTASVSPDSKAEIACMTCHKWHSSSLPKLLETTIAGSPITANNNEVCYACHVEPAIASYDTSPGDVHGAMDSTKTTGTAGLIAPYGYRQPQIRCPVCHNPHGTGNVYWIQPSINGTSPISVDGTAAVDRPQWEGMCAACHTYTHDSTTTYDLCVTCHFHGAGADGDSTTTF
ncbi:MAG: cytochrome c3 family protein [Actinomycetota bacterium]|nr:cytochrome c3 family protein [Actinomycetota bacterium]